LTEEKDQKEKDKKKRDKKDNKNSVSFEGKRKHSPARSKSITPQLYIFCVYCLFAEKSSYTQGTYNQNLNVAHPYVAPL
jgi:hypothetical protein